ncbi:hypothetical protein ACHAXR_001839, partial [Thalassiosira sp. AJA248-18]
DNEEESGPNAAIEIFATLLDESVETQGGTSLNAALCQYEYGNAWFRAAVRNRPFLDDANNDDDDDDGGEEDKKPAAITTTSSSSSPASQRRAKMEDNSKNDANDDSDGINDKNNHGGQCLSSADEKEVGSNNDADEDEEDEDGVSFALEMMETSLGILLSHYTNPNDGSSTKNDQNNKQPPEQKQWLLEQLPRILVCIGDLHSFREEFGAAVDAYCRALPYREEAWDNIKQSQKGDSNAEAFTLEGLQCQRRLVETNALVAEALLECPKGEDVVCYHDNDGEGSAVAAKKHGTGDNTVTVLVPAKERINYAQSYYENAREGLDEILYRMGKMAVAKVELGITVKEDVGFAASMVVGVGTALTLEKTA